MYVITFIQEVPQGFENTHVDLDSKCVADVLQKITAIYMRNNSPDLVLGKDDYEARRAVKGGWYTDEYILDRYCAYDYTFTVQTATYLK